MQWLQKSPFIPTSHQPTFNYFNSTILLLTISFPGWNAHLGHTLYYTSRFLAQKWICCHDRSRGAQALLIRNCHGIKPCFARTGCQHLIIPSSGIWCNSPSNGCNYGACRVTAFSAGLKKGLKKGCHLPEELSWKWNTQSTESEQCWGKQGGVDRIIWKEEKKKFPRWSDGLLVKNYALFQILLYSSQMTDWGTDVCSNKLTFTQVVRKSRIQNPGIWCVLNWAFCMYQSFQTASIFINSRENITNRRQFRCS